MNRGRSPFNRDVREDDSNCADEAESSKRIFARFAEVLTSLLNSSTGAWFSFFAVLERKNVLQDNPGVDLLSFI